MRVTRHIPDTCEYGVTATILGPERRGRWQAKDICCGTVPRLGWAWEFGMGKVGGSGGEERGIGSREEDRLWFRGGYMDGE